MKKIINFQALLQAFFTDRLMLQRQASPETIKSYRDAFCLLFSFIQQQKCPVNIQIISIG
jgi:site-specific recombinase XerD